MKPANLPAKPSVYEGAMPAQLCHRVLERTDSFPQGPRDVFVLDGRKKLHVFGAAVGTGPRGQVLAGVEGPQNTPVALKLSRPTDPLYLSPESEADNEAWYREAMAQAQTSDQLPVVHMPLPVAHGFSYRYAFIMPLQSGKLADCYAQMMRGLQRGSPAFRSRQDVVLKTLLQGLLQDAYKMAAMGYAHTDIRPSNILFSHATQTVVVTDRGHMVLEGAAATVPAAAPHSAPERLGPTPTTACSRKGDMYSLGYVLLTCALEQDVHAKVLRQVPALPPQAWGQALASVCQAMGGSEALPVYPQGDVRALIAPRLAALREVDPTVRAFILAALAAAPEDRPTATGTLDKLTFSDAERREQAAAWAATHFLPPIAQALEDAKLLGQRVRKLQPEL